MARAYVKFYPDVVDKVKRGMIGNLEDAGRYLRDEVRKSISTQGSRGIHSKPYHPPFRQSGKLMRSVRWEKVNKYGIRVVANVLYGIFLEFGTRKMSPRPFLRPAIWNNRARIRKILGAKKGISISKQESPR